MRYLKVLAGVGVSIFAVYKTNNAVISRTYCEENASVNGPKINDKKKMLSKLEEAITKSRELIQRVKDETGCPGIVIGVSVNGKDVWKEGLGYSDIENRTPCTADTVFRIASISKAITMGMVAKLLENGDLDLDKPIQHYLPLFPVKTFNGKKVEVTTRQLVSHLGGIRHYDKDYMEKNIMSSNNEDVKSTQNSLETNHTRQKEEKKTKETNKNEENQKQEKDEQNKRKKSEFENKEYYIKKHYNSVTESLTLFQDDPLVHEPGSKFLYTSHGWTVVSAVMEKAGNKTFDKLMLEYFKTLGLQNTYLEYNDPLVYHRGRHYVKSKHGRIINAPYVDNSYKWAGGGFISDVTDLLKYGNIMLYSYQWEPPSQTGTDSKGDKSTSGVKNCKGSNSVIQPDISKSETKGYNSQFESLPGYLKRETMEMIFTPTDKTVCPWDRDGFYGMGWAVVPEKHESGYCCHQKHYLSHTGGAIGASSVLLILPSQNYTKPRQTIKIYGEPSVPPHGVVVTIVTNLGSVGLNSVALQIAQIFESVNK